MKKEILAKKMIRLIIIIGLATYLFFLALSPFFIAFLHLINPGPKNKHAALKKGEALLAAARTVAVVGAHPDDLEWYAGGTLARLSKNGTRIIAIMATDGGRLSKMRHAEQLKAASVLKYREVFFLDYPDGSLNTQPQEEVVDKIVRIYQKYQPNTVITFDPYNQGPLYHHPDHIAAGKAAIMAAVQMNIPRIYLFHSSKSDTWVDTSKDIDLKIRGREAHKSQTKWFLTPFGMGYIIREVAFVDGRKVGLKYAEAFRKFH